MRDANSTRRSTPGGGGDVIPRSVPTLSSTRQVRNRSIPTSRPAGACAKTDPPSDGGIALAAFLPRHFLGAMASAAELPTPGLAVLASEPGSLSQWALIRRRFVQHR